MSSEKADTDPLPDAPRLDAAPERIDLADGLMARHTRIRESGKTTFDGDCIAVAYAAGLNANADVPRWRLC
jgi:hypothetical protein